MNNDNNNKKEKKEDITTKRKKEKEEKKDETRNISNQKITNVKILGSSTGAHEFPIQNFPHGRAWKYPDAKLIPWIGKDEWDGHIFVSGPTGAGKSWLIKEIIMNDFDEKRKAYLFSDVERKDPSFKEIYSSGKLKKVTFNPKEKWHIHPSKINKKKKAILVFDDTREPEWIRLRDRILERGRHLGLSSISVSHKLRDRAFTKVPKNESKWIITFPSSNKGEISRFLGENSLTLKQRQELLNISDEDGRYMIFHNFAPNFIITEKSVFRGI